VTMIFIREIHFSTLVQNCCGSTSVQKDPQSAHHTGSHRSPAAGAVDVICYRCCCCCRGVQWFGSLAQCDILNIFFRSTLFSGRICYGPVSVCLFVTSRSPAYNSHAKPRACICPFSVALFERFTICSAKMAGPFKPTPIHAKCIGREFRVKLLRWPRCNWDLRRIMLCDIIVRHSSDSMW